MNNSPSYDLEGILQAIAKEESFTGVDLQSIDLEGVNLAGANLSGAKKTTRSHNNQLCLFCPQQNVTRGLHFGIAQRPPLKSLI